MVVVVVMAEECLKCSRNPLRLALNDDAVSALADLGAALSLSRCFHHRPPPLNRR